MSCVGELLKRSLRHFVNVMILVFADDQTLTVLPDISAVRVECETVDVEEGTYRFFDELGRTLKPRFTSPVRRSSLLFGIQVVGGGNFELDVDPEDDGSNFDKSVANAVVIEPNRWFATIEEMAHHVAENRKRKLGAMLRDV